MKGFGYQLGKLLGTIVVTIHRTNKSALALVLAIAIISLLIFSGLTKTNKRTPVEGTALSIGGRAKINYFSRVNIRRSPGYLNKPRGDIVVTIPSAAIVEIIGGPQQSAPFETYPKGY